MAPRDVYGDCEFLTADPTYRGFVSVGLTDRAGRDYYAVNADMDTHAVYHHRASDGTYWMRNNVWRYLPTRAAEGYPYLLDRYHPDVKPFDQIRDEVADYFAGHAENHFYAYYGASDLWRIHSLWDNNWAATPLHVPKWAWDLKAEIVRAGNPRMPEQAGDDHHALADARHNRTMHQHLLDLAASRPLLPWADHLPDDELEAFLMELAAAAIPDGDNRAALGELRNALAAWRSTAHVHADPELLAALTTPIEPGDLVDAPRPQENGQ